MAVVDEFYTFDLIETRARNFSRFPALSSTHHEGKIVPRKQNSSFEKWQKSWCGRVRSNSDFMVLDA